MLSIPPSAFSLLPPKETRRSFIQPKGVAMGDAERGLGIMKAVPSRLRTNSLAIFFALTTVYLILYGCGGGGGGGSSSPAPTSAVIQGSVSGTIVMGIDENGEIKDKDDTTGRSPVNSTLPAKYPFSLKVPYGHKYHIHFIVGHGTPSERIVPLTSGATDIFSIANAGTIDLGFVDTSQSTATAEKDPLTQPGCTSGGQSGPKTLRVDGYKWLNLIDNTDGTVKYRAQVQVKDAAGNPLTSGTLVKDMKVYDNMNPLSPVGNIIFFNGSDIYSDTAGTQVLTPQSDVELYLAESQGTLPVGFYTVAITDNNGNLYTTWVYSGSQRFVSKPSNLQQVINGDNSITLSWTNPPEITPAIYGEYLIYVIILGNDLNGDGNADYIMYAYRVPPFDTYTIPASFVSSNLVGKAGLRWRVEIRQRTPASISFPDNTTLQPQFYRNLSAVDNLALPAILSADQATYESFSLTPNVSYICYWNLPSSGIPTSDNNYFVENHASLMASPLTNGTQIGTHSALTSLAATLGIPAAASNPTRYLVNGHIVVSSQPVWIASVTYKGDTIENDVFAADGITKVYSNRNSKYSVVPLTGTVASAPSDLAHWFNNLYYNPTLLSPTATWGAGAAYEKYTATYIGDTYEVTDYSSTIVTTGDTPVPAATNTTIAVRMAANGFTVNSDNATYTMANGTISVINGVNTYVATNPRPNHTTTQYRIFFDLNGNIYSGALIKDGTINGGNVYIDAGVNNYSMDYKIRLNKAAVDSLQSAVTF